MNTGKIIIHPHPFWFFRLPPTKTQSAASGRVAARLAEKVRAELVTTQRWPAGVTVYRDLGVPQIYTPQGEWNQNPGVSFSAFRTLSLVPTSRIMSSIQSRGGATLVVDRSA